MQYRIFPVPGTRRYRLLPSGLTETIYNRYIVRFQDGSEREFSIQFLGDRCFSLVDIGNARQKDKHYTSWERAMRGIQSVANRVCRMLSKKRFA